MYNIDSTNQTKAVNMKAKIIDIERNSFVDGPGIRTTVFFKGCNLKCKWCHNPESQSRESQLLYYKDKCTGCGRCKTVCKNSLDKCELCGECETFCLNGARKLCGKEYTADEVISEVIKDKPFYDESDGGVTFSGGECMLQIDFLCELLQKCKENGINTAVDTAGNVPFSYFERIMPYTDIILYDVKCVSEELHKEGTGVSNKLILDNLKRLSDTFDGDIIIRIPIIPTFNTDISELERIAELLRHLKIKQIDLLPYHRMGENKAKASNVTFTEYPTPTEAEMLEYKKIIKK